MFGEGGIGLSRQRFDVGQGWRRQSPPIAEMACHDNVVGEVLTPTKRLTTWPLMGDVWLSLREACMRMTTTSLAFAGVLLTLTLGTAVSGSAAVSGCNKQPNQDLSSRCSALEFAAQTKRPRVTIY